MIFVTMGQEDRANLVPVIDKIGHIRYNQINPQHIILRKGETGIENDDVIAILENGHILADFTQAAKGNNE
jgi:hypothetical protein